METEIDTSNKYLVGTRGKGVVVIVDDPIHPYGPDDDDGIE